MRVLNVSISAPEIVALFFFPLGISFITFSFLSFLLDISKDPSTDQGSLFQFANYILFFPKVQQGPIQDFTGFRKSITEINISTSSLYSGISRFIQGLAKKVLIADSLTPVADSVFSANLTDVGFNLSWYALFAFALQIYFDFSGYTDMAIGIGTLLGFDLPENFNSPYSCVSVADFWRRWHMTLTAWFRKYVFYPLEFRFRKLGVLRQPLNLLIVFFLTGAWHGLGPNFLVWGGYYGLILAIESLGLGRWLKRLPTAFQHFYGLLMVLFGWVFFRLETPSNWPIFFRALIGMNGMTGNITARTLNLLGYLPIVILAIILCVPLPKASRISTMKVPQGLTVVFQIVLLILSISFLVEGGYQAFLYRQF
jgi:alginate O-acetyltransferase complex protein AlgI